MSCLLCKCSQSLVFNQIYKQKQKTKTKLELGSRPEVENWHRNQPSIWQDRLSWATVTRKEELMWGAACWSELLLLLPHLPALLYDRGGLLFPMWSQMQGPPSFIHCDASCSDAGTPGHVNASSYWPLCLTGNVLDSINRHLLVTGKWRSYKALKVPRLR